MRILFVDYLAPVGHIGFNSYHIRLISQLCNDITFISQKKHINSCQLQFVNCVYFPESYFKSYKYIPRSIYNRIQDIFKLLYLKKYIKSSVKFDKIVFLSYDIMASGVITFNEDCYLVNHNNVDGLIYLIKRYLSNLLPTNYKQIVLAEFIKNYMQDFLPNKEILELPHGTTKVYCKTNDYKSPFGIEKFIYCPTASSCDDKLLFDIISDKDVQSYLTRHNITLIIKSNTLGNDYPNTYIVDSYIDEETYCNLMVGAIAIFAPYNKTFLHRISAVLMECLGNNIPIISTHSMCFEFYKKYANYNMIIGSSHEFIDTIKTICQMKGGNYYYNVRDLNPTEHWKNILEIK